jgi:hypothetical protein
LGQPPTPSLRILGSGPEAGATAARGLTREQVRAWALEAGFTDAGLAELPYAGEARDAARFEEWLSAPER